MRVLSLHTIKPLDKSAVIRAAKKTGVIVTIEEHSVTGGLGSAVADVLLEAGVRVRFKKMGIPDRPYHIIGSQEYSLEKAVDRRCDLYVMQLLRYRLAVYVSKEQMSQGDTQVRR